MSGSLRDRIAVSRRDLSPTEERAADALLDHLEDVGSYRAAELASLAGVSKATMSRLFRRLGYASFEEVRDDLRARRAAVGEPRRIAGGGDLTAHVRTESAAVAAVVTQPLVGEVVAALAGAERVTVIGWRASHVVAAHLRQQLAHVRGSVRLAPLPGQVLGEELADLVAGDVVVLVGFSRRPRGFAALLEETVATGATVVLLADESARPYASRVDLALECPVRGELAFDSYAAAMSLVTVLADGVLTRLGAEAQQRVGEISRRYARAEETEQHVGGR
ncbi:MurR/RpiR family transcriptional regulator [Nocardioidaceae bacterium]|nr:MurR/RpiR family transcriptional regulator [Nocardioidaceae bacterium]